MEVLPDMRGDSLASRSERLIPWASLLALILAAVLIYVRHYGAPGSYDADNLMPEDMYLDLFVKGNPWSLWGLPGAPNYVEFAVYFVLRWATGDLYAACALHEALMACLFASGAAYALLEIVDDAKERAAILIVAPLLAVVYPFSESGSIIASRCMHGLAFVSVFYGYGFFLRFMRHPQAWPALAAALAFASCMRASDKLFALWLLIPVAAMCCWLLWKGRMNRRDAACWLSLTGLCELAGRGIDAFLRNFPTSFNPLDFDIVRMCKLLGEAVLQTWSFAAATPGSALWFVAGLGGMALAYRSGTARQRDGVVFLLLAMAFNVLGIAAAGRGEIRYMPIFFLMPYTAGGLLLLAWIVRHMPPRIVILLPATAVAVPLAITLCIRSALPMHPPHYPELAAEMDELARTHGVRTGLADHWDARVVNVFSKEGVTLLPIHAYGYHIYMDIYSRVLLRDRVDMLLDKPDSYPYDRLNRELEIRANGEPDEIVRLKGGMEALIYRQGAHHPTEAELVLDGKRLMPERAEGDRVQWTGMMRLAGGLTLTEVRTLPRNGRHLALLVFKEPREAILGKKLVLSAVGDKLAKHKRELALRMSPEGDGWLDWFYALFLPDRHMMITEDNSAALPDGSSAAWGKLPAWNSREYLALFVHDGKARQRIK